MKPRHVLTLLAAALLLGSPLSAWGGVKYKVLHSFGSGSDGAGPNGPLVFDRKGDLYGVTIGGGDGCGDGGCGTVFELTPLSEGRSRESILYRGC